MTQTNPEQWALDLLADIIDIGGLGGPCSEADCVECGKVALKIQAAFAEREARLVGALESAEQAIAEYYRYWTGGETRGSYDGKPERAGLWKAQSQARATLAALKDRTHG